MWRWMVLVGLLVSVSGCNGTEALLPTATPTHQLTTNVIPTASAEPLSPTPLPPTATPIPEPTEKVTLVFYPSSPPPADAGWMVYRGRFESKAGTAGYSFAYPATWFLYPDPDGSATLQSVPASPGGGIQRGVVKIEVNFVPCEGPGCFQDVPMAVLSLGEREAWSAVMYDWNFNTTMQQVVVPVEGGAVQFTILTGGQAHQVPLELRAQVEAWLASVRVE